MGIVIKQSVRTTLISYIGVVIGAFNVLWLYPKFVEPEKIGVIRLLQDIPAILALFVQVGAFNLIDRFFVEFKDEKNKHNGFLTLISIYPLIGYSLFLLSYFVFHNFWIGLYESKSSLFTNYLIYILPLTFFIIYTMIMESYLRIHFNLVFASFVREILLRILYCTFIFVYALKLVSFDLLILFITSGYGICLLALIIYAQKERILLFTTNIQLPSKNILKRMGAYAFFLVAGSAGSILAHKIDTLMLGAISGSKENEGLINVAIYSIAYYIGSVVEIPRKSFAQIAIPVLSKAFVENDMNQIQSFYKKTSLIQLIAGIYILSVIWINVDYIFNFIPHSELYRTGKYVILLIGIAKLSDMITGVNGEIIQLSKYYKFHMLALLIMAFTTIISSRLLIPQYQVLGAALALTITIILFNIIKTIFVWSKMRMSPFSSKMIPVISFFALIIFLSYIIPYEESSLLFSFLQLTVRSLFVSIVFYFLVRKLKISGDLNGVIDVNLNKLSNLTGLKFISKL